MGLNIKTQTFEVTILNEHIYLYALRSFKLFFAFSVRGFYLVASCSKLIL